MWPAKGLRGHRQHTCSARQESEVGEGRRPPGLEVTWGLTAEHSPQKVSDGALKSLTPGAPPATELRLPPENGDRLPASDGTLLSTPPTGEEAEVPMGVPAVEAGWSPSLAVMAQGSAGWEAWKARPVG